MNLEGVDLAFVFVIGLSWILACLLKGWLGPSMNDVATQHQSITIMLCARWVRVKYDTTNTIPRNPVSDLSAYLLVTSEGSVAWCFRFLLAVPGIQ